MRASIESANVLSVTNFSIGFGGISVAQMHAQIECLCEPSGKGKSRDGDETTKRERATGRGGAGINERLHRQAWQALGSGGRVGPGPADREAPAKVVCAQDPRRSGRASDADSRGHAGRRVDT